MYSRNGRWLVGITDDGWLNCWDLQAEYRQRHWFIGALQVTTMVFHPRVEHGIFLASADGAIAHWDLQEQCCLDRVNAPAPDSLFCHHEAISSLRALPDPDQLISCNVAGSIRVWDLTAAGLQEAYRLEFPWPYQGMQMAETQGLNSAQLLTLKQLGAIDR
jgi:WD40 repeat protein